MNGLELGANSAKAVEAIKPLLTRKDIFGLDLVEIGLAELVEKYFYNLIKAPGAVRDTLHLVATDSSLKLF